MFEKINKERENLRMEIPINIKKKLDSFIQDSEKIIYSYKGATGTHIQGSRTSIASSSKGFGAESGSRQLGSPWLIITNERVLIIGKGLLSIDIREIPIENIKSIDYEQGLLIDTLTLYAHSSVEGIKFYSAERKHTSKFPRLIKELMKKDSSLAKENNEEDPLKVLKLRFAKGEVSKNEYEQMKKSLSD